MEDMTTLALDVGIGVVLGLGGFVRGVQVAEARASRLAARVFAAIDFLC
jgi:hypothetical protein